MKFDTFIERTYINKKTSEELNFQRMLRDNNISIILGEPSSGKTYQLEKYMHDNPKHSIFVELMFLDEIISDNIDVVLLDSIDEALYNNGSDKALKRNLIKYINECKKINPNVKFIITCRYVEWKEVFEEALISIDKELKLFYIKDLIRDDIYVLLEQSNINKDEFWNFIEQNYLENLLKNIMMVLHLIDNFNDYKGKRFTYSKIYQEIIEAHIVAETNNERGNLLKTLPLAECLEISSSIGMYMTLNRTRAISLENINKLANDLYVLDNINITGEKLNIIFDTSLFKGNRKDIRFFHKSIQEYLSAYFINLKKFNISIIKEIFAYEYSFYEEFEEVIIYLTNIEESFFKHFIAFDPLIFRRHPHLSKEEQEFLVQYMLTFLKKERQRAWSKLEYLQDSSLVIFPLVTNIASIVKKCIDINDVNLELFTYLKGLLSHKYSLELEDILFEILEKIKRNKRLCIEYIKISKVSNLNYNKRLFTFIVKNDLIDDKEEYLYLDLFSTLYNEVDFKYLIILISNFSLYEKDKLFEIKIDDILFWLKNIIENYDKRNKEYFDEQISFIIFLVLRSYKYLEDKSILNIIFKFIENNFIHINLYISDYEKINYTLNFDDIKDDFWKYFFNQSLDNIMIGNILKLIKFYNLEIKDIEELSSIYKIEEYKEYYIKFIGIINNIDNFLMQNSEFKLYMEDIWKKDKELEKYWRDDEWELEQKKKEDEKLKIYHKSISSLKTKSDILNIYFYARYKNDREDKTYNKLLSDLEDKYTVFIDLVKESFKNDNLYVEIEKEISKNNVYYFTILFDYLFLYISKEEIDELIYNKEEYKKLFFHTLKNRQLSKDYFVYISNKNIDNLISLSIKVFKTSIIEYKSKNPLLYIYNQFIDLFKKLNIFKKENLKTLIEEIKNNISIYYRILHKEDKRDLIKILLIDDDNYDFIKNLLLKDRIDFKVYFKGLLIINLNRAIDDYINHFYPKNSSRIVFNKIGSMNIMKKISHNKFDIFGINQEHRESFKDLMNILTNVGDIDIINYHKIDDNNLKFILVNYFDFFKEYYHPKGIYSIDIYDNMDKIINGIFSTFESSLEKINLLNELKNYPNKRLQTKVKRQLEICYNLQLKNREFNNEYYKNIIDNFNEEDNSRFFDFDKLKNDLIDISLLFTESRKSIYQEIEDLINDRYRDALTFKDYITSDQSRGGESESKKSVGERDLVIRNKDTGVTESVIEAFILKADTSQIIDTHYNKLVLHYDTIGSKNNFILVYSKAINFEELWIKYQKHFPSFIVEENPQEYLKVGYTIKNNMKITHLFINFYSEEETS